jgi:SAM-dependent methyltransferase
VLQRDGFSRPTGDAVYEGFDYTAFWDVPGRPHLDRLEQVVVADLLPRRGRRALDAGCGFGRLTHLLVDRFDEVVVVDAAWSALEQARDRWGDRVTVVAADLQQLPFRAASFDSVLLVRVLHHFPAPSDVLAGIRRITADSGCLVANVSNKRNLRRIARAFALGDVPAPFAPGIVPYDRLSFGCHPSDFEGWVEKAGFRPVRWRGVGVMDKVASRAGWIGHVLPSGRLMSRLLGRWRLAPSLFCAADATGPAGDRVLAASPFSCPTCGRPLKDIEVGYRCRRCARTYPRVDGILDFRL